MDDKLFAQMLQGIRSTTAKSTKKALEFTPPDDLSYTKVEIPPTEIKSDDVGPKQERTKLDLEEETIPPIKPGDLADPNTFVGPPQDPNRYVIDLNAPDDASHRRIDDTNKIDLNQSYAAQNAPSPTVADALPLPLPKEPELPYGQLTDTGMGKKPSSALKLSQPRPAAQEQSKVIETGTSSEQKPDDRMNALNERQRSVDAERMSSLEQAAKARNMSTEEAVALALVTLLPTIVGGIAGSAIAGKAGGAAGVAGGLAGGSQGINTVVSQKQKDRDDALAQAAKAGQRSDALEAEKGQRQGQIEGMAEHDKTRAANKELTLMKEEGDTKRSQAANAAHLRAANISAYSHIKGAQIAANSALAKAEARAAAAEQGGSLKDYQGKAATFATGMLTAEHVLSQVKQPTFLNSFRSWGGIKNAMTSGNPEEQMYARAVYSYLDAVARDESGSAINEGEWDQYFNTYFPRNTSSTEDIEYARRLRMTRMKTMLGKAGPEGARIAVDAYQSEFAPQPKQEQNGAPPAAPGQAQAQGGSLTQKWGAGR